MGDGVPVLCSVSQHDHSVISQMGSFDFPTMIINKMKILSVESNRIVYLVESRGNRIISCKGLLAVNHLKVGGYSSIW